MGKVCMFLAYYYVVYFSEINEEMKRSRLGKVVEFFKVIGIIAGAIWSVISIVKELVLIPWAEWAHNGVLEHIFGVLKGIIIFPACLFLIKNRARIPLALAMGRKRANLLFFSFSPIY